MKRLFIALLITISTIASAQENNIRRDILGFTLSEMTDEYQIAKKLNISLNDILVQNTSLNTIEYTISNKRIFFAGESWNSLVIITYCNQIMSIYVSCKYGPLAGEEEDKLTEKRNKLFLLYNNKYKSLETPDVFTRPNYFQINHWKDKNTTVHLVYNTFWDDYYIGLIYEDNTLTEEKSKQIYHEI